MIMVKVGVNYRYLQPLPDDDRNTSDHDHLFLSLLGYAFTLTKCGLITLQSYKLT